MGDKMKQCKTWLRATFAFMLLLSAATHAEGKVKLFDAKIEIDETVAVRLFMSAQSIVALGSVVNGIKSQIPDSDPDKKSAVSLFERQMNEAVSTMTADTQTLKALGVAAKVFEADCDLNRVLQLCVQEIGSWIQSQLPVARGAAVAPGVGAASLQAPFSQAR
jgi:hypothetical protein